jgi:prevent-host-death family protein
MRVKAKRAAEPKIQYITDRGKPVAVVMKLSRYRALMERMEDLEDSLDLSEARRTATGFVTLEQFKKDVAAKRKR